MCFGGGAEPAEVKKADPVVTDEDQNKGSSVIASRERAKVAALYGPASMRTTGALGLMGPASTAAKRVTGA